MEGSKDGTECTDGNLREKKSFICPVCGNLLHERNLLNTVTMRKGLPWMILMI